MTDNQSAFQVIKEPFKITSGKVGWRSPSNIALVKYWGKRLGQIPENPSISLTLSASHTDTYCSFEPKEEHLDRMTLSFKFEGKENPAFGDKIKKWLTGQLPNMPWLSQFELLFESTNSFPHSAGIASSASAMSAVSLCLGDMEKQIYGKEDIDYQKASFLSRQGSGSACRSVYPHAAMWGQMEGGNDQFAVPMSDAIDPIWHTFKDTILIVDRSPKSVSSTVGHGLMKDNVFAAPRYAQARQNMTEILAAMKTGDLEKAGTIIEQEALTLHAMMMLSDYILLKPGSLVIIEAVRQFRREKGWPLYFTIDAGPNIHLLYPDEISLEVESFIKSELQPLCQEGQIIYDAVGTGPTNLLL